MSFGLEVYSAAGKKIFTTQSPGYCVIGYCSIDYASGVLTKTFSFPEATGFTVGVLNLFPLSFTVTTTYPGGVPTVQLDYNTGTGWGFWGGVIVYVSAYPTASGFGLWAYDLNGDPAIVNSNLPAYCYEGEITLSASGAGDFNPSEPSRDCSIFGFASAGDILNLWPSHETGVLSGNDRILLWDVPNTTTAQYGIVGAMISDYDAAGVTGRCFAYGVTPVCRAFRKIGSWSTEVGGYGMKLFNESGARAYSTEAAPLRLLDFVTLAKSTFSWDGSGPRIGDPGTATYTYSGTLPSDVMYVGNTYSGAIGDNCTSGKLPGAYNMAAASLGWQKISDTQIRAVTVPTLYAGYPSGGWWNPTPASSFDMQAFFVDRTLYV